MSRWRFSTQRLRLPFNNQSESSVTTGDSENPEWLSAKNPPPLCGYKG
ncbi:MAG: hypothetical protein ACR2MG_15235 [Pyrinomonadaceae bacterium]